MCAGTSLDGGVGVGERCRSFVVKHEHRVIDVSFGHRNWRAR